VRVERKVPRGVFFPVPNVDSVLVGLKRHSPAPPKDLVKLVQHGFKHRRKAMAKSLELSPGGSKDLRDRVREALVAIGKPADARAESLSPAQWRAFHEQLS
jgi:16S rRNA (adenine1518-N6/adenine1519-N6)-dimethyltransferase